MSSSGERYGGMTDQAAIGSLLEAIKRGERGAFNQLFPLVYDELSALAHRQRQAWHGELTLGTTAIVHELYLKLVDGTKLRAESRAHFFAVAAQAMRHILCNYARDRHRQKRGAGVQHISLDPDQELPLQLDLSDEQSAMLVALDEALRQFERGAERQARVVECRFFGGMSVEETAAALGISVRTVKRDWSFARAWLRRQTQLLLGAAD